MNCKNCNNPVAKHMRHCPNCGRQVGGSLGGSGLHEQQTPKGGALSPSSAVEVEEELPLQDEVTDDSTSSGLSESAAGQSARGSYSKVRPSKKSRPERKKSAAAQTAPPASPPPAGPSPAEVCAMVVEQPDLLEAGLSVETDKSGKSIGAGLSTEVGTIDLLARDDAGGLVVVMVSGPDVAKDVVGDILQRIGWVRKHHAKKGQDVRGIVVMAEVPEEVAYAAAAVAHTVSFKTFRLSVAFDDVDL
ncbi:MAG: hypothetical protein ACQGVK_08350 [Myxococcota bacterium]